MTNKKRRQRGSRTHGGGTHKNRRGAGHRGGRGRAGSKKHEFHNYGSFAKHGFTRPEDAQDEVLTVDIQKLDEDAVLFVADDRAEEDGDAYVIDARDVVEDGWEADAVKVLGGGQVRNELHVTADDFSESAVELIEGAGGETTVSERGREADEPEDTQASDSDGE